MESNVGTLVASRPRFLEPRGSKKKKMYEGNKERCGKDNWDAPQLLRLLYKIQPVGSAPRGRLRDYLLLFNLNRKKRRKRDKKKNLLKHSKL